MPEIIETIVYRLDELSDAAKDAARGWYREGGFDYDWFEFVYDDFERICTILGISLRTRSVRLFGGGTRSKPCIWFSGFWSQGDGACFEGDYRHARAAVLGLDGDEEALRRWFLRRAGLGQGVVEIERTRGILRRADVEQAREVREIVCHDSLPRKWKSPAWRPG